MNYTVLIAATIAIIVALIYVASQRRKGGDIAIPPAPQRAFFFGPYGYWMESQLAETKGWTNLHLNMFRRGGVLPGPGYTQEADDSSKINDAISAMKFMGCATVLDVDAFVYRGPVESRTLDPTGEERLRNVLTRMQTAGVLSQVQMIAPCDEPNGRDGGLDSLPLVVPMIRRVAAEFSETAKVLIGSSFTTIRPWGYLELFDVVGCDEYSAKSSILGPDGALQRLRNDCKNGQRFMLFPGACDGQAIEPFLNYANGHSDVWGIVYFLHRLNPAEGTVKALPDQPELFAEYRAAGQAIVNAKE